MCSYCVGNTVLDPGIIKVNDVISGPQKSALICRQVQVAVDLGGYASGVLPLWFYLLGFAEG